MILNHKQQEASLAVVPRMCAKQRRLGDESIVSSNLSGADLSRPAGGVFHVNIVSHRLILRSLDGRCLTDYRSVSNDMVCSDGILDMVFDFWYIYSFSFLDSDVGEVFDLALAEYKGWSTFDWCPNS